MELNSFFLTELSPEVNCRVHVFHDWSLGLTLTHHHATIHSHAPNLELASWLAFKVKVNEWMCEWANLWANNLSRWWLMLWHLTLSVEWPLPGRDEVAGSTGQGARRHKLNGESSRQCPLRNDGRDLVPNSCGKVVIYLNVLKSPIKSLTSVLKAKVLPENDFVVMRNSFDLLPSNVLRL